MALPEHLSRLPTGVAVKRPASQGGKGLIKQASGLIKQARDKGSIKQAKGEGLIKQARGLIKQARWLRTKGWSHGAHTSGYRICYNWLLY